MPSITFIAPQTLSSKELTALREGNFELHSVSMRLESVVEGGRVFTGSGSIRQTSNGELNFTLYTPEEVSIIEVLQGFTISSSVPVGTIIPENKYFRLSAVDVQGRQWICNRFLPDINSGQVGTICTGKLDEIIYDTEADPSITDFLFLEIFDDVKLPYNIPTVINKTAGDRESISHSLNILQFDACGFKFTLEKEAESLQLRATATEARITEFFETRVIETLQFVLARPLVWSMMIKQSEGRKRTHIRRTFSENLRYKIKPPIAITAAKPDWFCKLFELYLNYVNEFDEDKLHPVSAQMRTVCRASIGNVETSSLILSVAIESILKYVYQTKFHLTAEEKKWIKTAQKYFRTWEGPEGLSKRITGLFSVFGNPSAAMRLDELVEIGAITTDQKRDWGNLRHKLAHGETLGSVPLQEFLDLSNKVLVLFYHLVFFAIGYEGEYTDYSSAGWPLRDYKVKLQELDQISDLDEKSATDEE